jgi:2'-5' RNA ligase superfamily
METEAVGQRSALVIAFPELGPLLEPWLEHSIGGRPSHGVPPHVTILFPSPPEIGDALDDAVAFDVEFLETRRFPVGAVYLAPEPPDPFIDLTRRVWGLFPDWPPYGGEFLPDITPHLTIAWGALLDEAEAAVAAHLPLRACVR